MAVAGLAAWHLHSLATDAVLPELLRKSCPASADVSKEH